MLVAYGPLSQINWLIDWLMSLERQPHKVAVGLCAALKLTEKNIFFGRQIDVNRLQKLSRWRLGSVSNGEKQCRRGNRNDWNSASKNRSSNYNDRLFVPGMRVARLLSVE